MFDIEETLQGIMTTLRQIENDIAVIREDMQEMQMDMVDVNYQICQMLERMNDYD